MKKSTKILAVILAILIILITVLGTVFLIDSMQNKISNSEKNSDIRLTIHQNDFTTTESLQTITGSFKSESEVLSIEYKVEVMRYSSENDYLEVVESGNAEIIGNDWSINKIRLLPENNKITIKLTTTNGESIDETINIYYERGKTYTPDKNNIVTDSETGITYVNNIIKITFASSTTEEQRDEIIKSINGEIVGSINTLKQYHVQIESHSLSELKSMCEELETNEEVLSASYDSVIEFEDSSVYIPNDPWTTDQNNVQLLDEQNPNGNNWWIEATQLPSAWQYDKYFNDIEIGIVDCGVDINHEDLDVNFINKKYKYQNTKEYSKKDHSHGTHVAGIISAKHNNGKGIQGVISQEHLKLYSIDYKTAGVTSLVNRMLSSTYEDTLVSYVESGIKIINYSLNGTQNNWMVPRQEILEQLTLTMAQLISQDYDFLIVNSAGNDGMDATKKGPFGMITEETYTEKAKKNTRVPFSSIYDSIIIVGNAMQVNDKYMLNEKSNFGTRIDITAPGTDIYSTINDNKYKTKDGTSMSAPIVTGIAGLVWSINPDLTSGEVKDIVCNSVDTDIIVYNNQATTSLNNTYKLVNAKLAVEESLSRIEDSIIREQGELVYVKGCIIGNIKDKNTDEFISADISVYTVNENGNKQKYDDYYYNGKNDFKVELPIGNYIFEIQSSTDEQKIMQIYVNLDDRLIRQIGTLYLDNEKNTTSEQVNSSTYINEEYGWSVELPTEWIKYGSVGEYAGGFNHTILGQVGFHHKEIHESAPLSSDMGLVFDIGALPHDEYETLAQNHPRIGKLAENSEYVFFWTAPTDLRVDESSEDFERLYNEYNILYNTRDSILESFKLLE